MARSEEAVLNVVHADHVARLAERVSKGVAGGRYFCTCASPELRGRIERALADALGGPEHVVPVDVSGGDPWNTVRLKQLDERLPVRRTVYAIHGLSEAASTASERGAKHPYEQLNFARDGLSASGTHLLVWLDGIGEIERVSEMAPDLWTYRTEVVAFLSELDFPVAAGAPPSSRVTRELARVEERLLKSSGMERAELLNEASILNRDAGNLRLALRLADEAEVTADGIDEWQADAIRNNSRLHRIQALRALGRLEDARRMAQQALVDAQKAGSLTGEAMFAQALGTILALVGDLPAARSHMQSAIEVPTDALRDWPARPLLNLAVMELDAGQLRHAGELLIRAQGHLPKHCHLDGARVRELNSTRQWRLGDGIAALAEGATAVDRLREDGAWLHAEYALQALEEVYAELGLMEAWQAIIEVPSPTVDTLVPNREVKVAAVLAAMPGRLPVAKARAQALVDLLTSTIRGADGELRSGLEALVEAGCSAPKAVRPIYLIPALDLARALAPRGGEPPVGVREHLVSRALHALNRDREAAAPAVRAHAWAVKHRGPGVVSDVECLLSEIDRGRSQSRNALAHAERALTNAIRCTDNYRIVAAHRARARALVALDRVPEARAALEDALAVVRPEGLRPVEVRLLQEIAELPSGDDRAAVAREALLLAKELMFPREEARALLNLARLGIASGEPTDTIRRWIDRAAMWTEALGPIDRLDTIKELRESLSSRA